MRDLLFIFAGYVLALSVDFMSDIIGIFWFAIFEKETWKMREVRDRLIGQKKDLNDLDLEGTKHQVEK